MFAPVVGFDVGSLTCYVAVPKSGGLEVIANEYSDRCTNTCVAFSGDLHLVGTSATMQHIMNPENTFKNYVQLIGKKFSSPAVMNERKFMTNDIHEWENGSVAYKLTLNDAECDFTPEQFMALQLNKLRTITEQFLGSNVRDFVLNVPTNYTNSERYALLSAASIAGLNCVKLVNDITAGKLFVLYFVAATVYGLYSSGLPPANSPPRIVVIIISGYSCTQLGACAFNTDKVDVLATVCDRSFGGRNFDNVLFEHFSAEFKAKYKLDVRRSKKATLRLLQECEKLKKLMSANATDLPINVECLMGEKDFSSSMKRADFESLSSNLLDGFNNLLRNLMESAQLTPDKIHSVEFIGGNSRVPILKTLVTNSLKMECRASMNADEAVARGCALQAALCSPITRIRKFVVNEAQPYQVVIFCNNIENGQNPVRLTHPLVKLCKVTLNCRNGCSFEARYDNPNAANDGSLIGTYKVIGLPDNARSRVQLYFNFNKFGILEVKAKSEEILVDNEVAANSTNANSEHAEENSKLTEDLNAPTNGDVPIGNDAERLTEGKTPAKEKPSKGSVKCHDLKVEVVDMHMDETTLSKYQSLQAEIIQRDKLERERSNARNALEEYVYDMRAKLEDQLVAYVTDDRRTHLQNVLRETEDWLYGDGESEKRQTYVERLLELQAVGNPIEKRAYEHKNRPLAVQNFDCLLESMRNIIKSVCAKDGNFDHLNPVQVDELRGSVHKNEEWIDQLKRRSFNNTEDPDVSLSDIDSRRKAMESMYNSILNTPKPAPPQPPTGKTENAEMSNAENSNGMAANEENGTNVCPTKNKVTDEHMDVD